MGSYDHSFFICCLSWTLESLLKISHPMSFLYVYILIDVHLNWLNCRVWIGKQKQLCKKSDHSKENSLLQAKHFLGFVKGFSESVKGIYETCNCNFFNLAIIIVFPTLQFILYYYILLEPWKDLWKTIGYQEK